MSERILAKNRLHVVSAAQRLPCLPASDNMSVSIQGNGPMPVIYATQDLLTRLLSYTTSVLIMVKGLLYAVYAAVDLCTVALAIIIKNVVGARGSRFMKSVWSATCRLKALIFDVRS